MERIDYWTAVHAQPEALRTTLGAARAALAAGPVPAWPAGTPLAVLAMGASTFAAEALVAVGRDAGRVVLNWPASDWTAAGPAVPVALAISESGRSPETIAALRLQAGARVALTNVPGSPVTADAGLVVDWGRVPDAGIYVTGFTSSLVALALTAEALGLAGAAAGVDELPARVDTWLPAAERAVDGYLDALGAAPTAVEFAGSGTAWAAACEGTLLTREAGRTPGAAYAVDQYLHGPAEALRPGVGLVVFGDGRTEALVARAEDAGVPVLQVAARPTAAHALALPDAGPFPRVALQAIVAQFLAGRLGDRRGHELGTFAFEFEGTKLPPG